MKTYQSELRPIKVVVAILWVAAAAMLATTYFVVPRSEEISIRAATPPIKADSGGTPIKLQPVSARVPDPDLPSR